MIFFFELDYFNPSFLSVVHGSPYKDGSAEERHYYKKFIMPTFVYFTKISLNLLYALAYTASFVDDNIFPFLKRLTAISICSVCSRLTTVAVPYIADLPKPWPETILVVVVVIAFVLCFTFPLDSYDEQEAPEQSDVVYTKPSELDA